jgi:hypothetical protein
VQELGKLQSSQSKLVPANMIEQYTKNYMLSTHGLSIDFETLLSPLHVYVASDDDKVLYESRQLGFIVAPTLNLSASLGTLGAQNYLSGNLEHGYTASLEILFDIFMLSHGNTMVGICSSQVSSMLISITVSASAIYFERHC